MYTPISHGLSYGPKFFSSTKPDLAYLAHGLSENGLSVHCRPLGKRHTYSHTMTWIDFQKWRVKKLWRGWLFHLNLLGSDSPPVLKSPVLSHFKTDEGYVVKIKYKDNKDATPNRTCWGERERGWSCIFFFFWVKVIYFIWRGIFVTFGFYFCHISFINFKMGENERFQD